MSGGDYGGRRKFNRVKVHSNPISQGWNTQSHHPPSTCNHIKVIQYTFHVQRNTFRQYRNRRIIRGPNTWKVFHHIYRKPIMWLKQAQLRQLKDSLSNDNW